MDCSVRFLPSDITINVPKGTTISDASRLAGLTTLHLPCGGRGTCGKCTVQLSSSSVPTRSVLACRTTVNEDCTITLPHITQHSDTSIVADSTIDHIDQQSSYFSPLSQAVTVSVTQPVPGVNRSDLERLELAIANKIKQKPDTSSPTVQNRNRRLICERKILQQLAYTLRSNNGMVSAIITETEFTRKLNDMQPGAVLQPIYGIVCDIGTTTVSIRLIDCKTGAIIVSASDYNAQISRGTDIISRIDYARTPEHLQELNTLIIDTVNNLISTLIKETKVCKEHIIAMVITGNCTMTHLFLGLQPEYIREAPYVPTVNYVPPLRAADCSLRINPEATVLFAPGVGSYVGGDITAGLLCTDMISSADSVTLFIDIGTNGEIVIGNSEFLLTCACSAGPAFEGSGVKDGMRADMGAIDSFAIDPKVRAIEYTVIGNGLPRGICGSGFISLLGELLCTGYIDRSGRLTDKAGSDRLVTIDATKGLLLVDAAATEHKDPILITESDINNLIRTKAAIYAACDLLLKSAGLEFSTLDKVLIAGGFGKYIDIKAAIRIGLFPDIDLNKFSYLGNTSLAGAARMLLSKQYRSIINELPGKMTYIDLSSEPGYMDAYTSALFLPHTELERFPSVK